MKRALALALVLALVPGCRRKHVTKGAAAPGKTAWGETPLVTVGAGAVTVEQLQRRYDAVRQAHPDAPPDARAVLDQLVDQEVLVQEAVRRGILARDNGVREQLVGSLMAQAGLQDRMPAPTPDALRAYFEAHKAEFPAVERMRVRHVLLLVPPGATDAQVEQARARAARVHDEAVKNPADFENLARRESADPNAQAGGDLGMLSLDKLRLLMGDQAPTALSNTETGAVGPVIRSQQGFHVFQLVERVGADTDPIRVYGGDLLEAYMREQRGKQRADFVAKLKAEHPVVEDAAKVKQTLTATTGR